ncbi:MAG: hypothetical protein WCC92_15695 [Candidatus Korobacteraceae bacterium]
MTKAKKMTMALVFLVLSTGAISVQAQWVVVARAVAGRVQQMSDRSQNGSGFDVATVVLEANADKVYQTAIKNLSARNDLKITKQDAKKRIVQFTNGQQVASLQATPLGDKITQLVIASNLGPHPDATSLVVQGVLHVCKDMNVDCTLEGQ